MPFQIALLSNSLPPHTGHRIILRKRTFSDTTIEDVEICYLRTGSRLGWSGGTLTGVCFGGVGAGFVLFVVMVVVIVVIVVTFLLLM